MDIKKVGIMFTKLGEKTHRVNCEKGRMDETAKMDGL